MKILAVRAGSAQFRESPQGQWRSAIEKHRVTGPVRVHSEGLLPDEQADRESHGGRDKAILAYCRDHYPLWQIELNRPDIGPGAMGENLEVIGQTEQQVFIGDSYRLGDVIVQVSQPRQPCRKPALFNGISDLTKQIAAKGRTGWYLRVLKEGTIEAPCEIDLLDRPHPDWSVDRVNKILYQHSEGPDAILNLANLPELSAAWRERLMARV